MLIVNNLFFFLYSGTKKFLNFYYENCQTHRKVERLYKDPLTPKYLHPDSIVIKICHIYFICSPFPLLKYFKASSRHHVILLLHISTFISKYSDIFLHDSAIVTPNKTFNYNNRIPSSYSDFPSSL